MYESYHLGLFLTDIVSKMGAIIFRVIVIAALMSDFAFEWDQVLTSGWLLEIVLVER
jgi:hypothetical protein